MRGLNNCNPIASALYFLAASGIAMFSMNPVILITSAAGSALFQLCISGLKNLRFYLFSLLFFSAMSLLNPLLSHNGATVLFVMNDAPITAEALIYGMFAAMMIISVLYWFKSFTELMTSDKLLYVFGAFSPSLALILSMSLRYVPLFGRQIRKTENAQRTLGLYKDDNIADTVRGKLSVFGIVVTWGLENGITTADSMSARGYGCGRRTHYSIFSWHISDTALVMLTAALSAVCLFCVQGADYSYYPYFAFSSVSTENIIGYAAYGALAVLPSAIEIKEALRWKLLRSKI